VVDGIYRKRKDTVRPFEEQAEMVCVLCGFYLSSSKQYVFKMNFWYICGRMDIVPK